MKTVSTWMEYCVRRFRIITTPHKHLEMMTWMANGENRWSFIPYLNSEAAPIHFIFYLMLNSSIQYSAFDLASTSPSWNLIASLVKCVAQINGNRRKSWENTPSQTSRRRIWLYMEFSIVFPVIVWYAARASHCSENRALERDKSNAQNE